MLACTFIARNAHSVNPARILRNMIINCKFTVCRSSSGQDIDKGKLDSNEDDIEDDNDEDINHNGNNENAIIKNAEFKLAHFLKGWLSFSRLWCRRRMRLEGRTHHAMKLGRI